MSLEAAYHEAVQKRKVAIRVRGIWQKQEVNEMWLDCVYRRKSLKEVAVLYQNSILVLMRYGFNRNFLTRSRWLDIPTLINMSDYTQWEVFKRLLDLSEDQISEWRLSDEEWDLLLFKETPMTFSSREEIENRYNSTSTPHPLDVISHPYPECQMMGLQIQGLTSPPSSIFNQFLTPQNSWNLTASPLGLSYQMDSTRS